MGSFQANGARTSYAYDVAVAYRIYPKVSKPAQGLPFGDDKLRQAEVCLRSFRESLGSLRVKVWAILDGCPAAYRELFRRYFSPAHLVVQEFDGIGNRATYEKQLEILLSQSVAEFVYFAEDDYLYLAGQFQRMLRFLRAREDAEFVSPYDHPDCYNLDLHHGPKWVTVFEDHHWRTAASTCLTFLTRKQTLARYEDVFRTYSGRNDDCAMWVSLTKTKVFNPLAMLRYLGRREFYRNVLIKSWLLCWPQILFGRTAKLWVPVPGIATHLSEGLLSPGIDWRKLMCEPGAEKHARSVPALDNLVSSA
jgi:hypothetical protein